MPAQHAALVAAAGADWEAPVLRRLDTGTSGVTLLKRCVDLPDLLASATTGQATVAVVAADLGGLDADSVTHLERCGVTMFAVVDEADAGREDRLHRMGIRHVVPVAALDTLRERFAVAERPDASAPASGDGLFTAVLPATRTRSLAVWGPTGAPGRTTVAVGVAAELAHRGVGTLLVDADTYSGAVAQHLGILDEVSGLLAAARAANAGQIDVERLAAFAREVSPSLRVLSGLPRADRWSEVRDSAFEQVLELAGSLADIVVTDVGFCLEQDRNAAFGSPAPQRNAMTLSTLESADEIVVVGSADPVGLGRLARGLVELDDAVPGAELRVVVNRMRGTLRWREDDIRRTLADFAPAESVCFLPEDRTACDRALVGGKSLVETGDSALRRALSGLVDSLAGPTMPARGPARLGRRSASRRKG